MFDAYIIDAYLKSSYLLKQMQAVLMLLKESPDKHGIDLNGFICLNRKLAVTVSKQYTSILNTAI